MKKITLLLLLVVTLCLISCELDPYITGTIYFYSMAGEHNEDSTASLKYREDGYDIIMSRGEAGKRLSKSAADKLIGKTDFTLKLDGTELTPISTSKSTKKLGNTGYHVVQSYTLGALAKGTYELVGKTVFHDHEGRSRLNKVTLTIK